jgi:tRNA1Val (adenine37-N6)-methyltransferase
MFHFKQFSVDQQDCAMKINTDGVLLGALAEAAYPKNILDIGTGTGVIALMLAQRFTDAVIDAVEIDEQAAQTATQNFTNSSFKARLTVYPFGFREFFDQYPDKKYDLIVSNPPFYINSLKSSQKGKQLAKHADGSFFENLVKGVSEHLNPAGVFCLILPVDTAELVKNIIPHYQLFICEQTNIYSYAYSEMHRQILYISAQKCDWKESDFIIYDAPNTHSAGYRAALKDFFTIF